MLIVESHSLNIYRNLAIEEYLMEYSTEPVLFLWRSDGAVVMGKNQNPWRECRLARMRDDGVPLARRISGGGTVYHDEGNLNYCVIVDRTQYREKQAYDMVIQALERLGVRAEKSGQSNLTVKGLKFSGNAFCFRKGRALHHGTLLLNTNLEQLGRYLGSSLQGIKTHAIRSVPAQVTNLKLDIKTLSAALIDGFQTLYSTGTPPQKCSDTAVQHARLEPLLAKQHSLGWIYGATPKFSLKTQALHLEVAKGIVVSAHGSLAQPLLNTAFYKSSFSLPCDVD